MANKNSGSNSPVEGKVVEGKVVYPIISKVLIGPNGGFQVLGISEPSGCFQK